MSGKVKVSHFIGMAVIEAFTQLFYTTKIFQMSFKRSRFALEDLKRSEDLNVTLSYMKNVSIGVVTNN